MIKRIISLIFFLALLCPGTSKADVRFPFLGKIKADKVNIRAGQSINFERLCQLNKDRQVVVTKRNYSWYQIKMPEEARAYISEKYLQPIVDNIYVVTGHRVNVRAGTSERFSVLGQLNEGTKVRVTGRKEGFFEIEPVEGLSAWVLAKFVKFKSFDIPTPKTVQLSVRRIKKKKTIKVFQKTKPPKEQIFSATGQLEDLGRILPNRDIRYKLVLNGKPAYYLIGPSRIFDPFIHLNVKVQGKIRSDPKGTYIVPVIVVSKVNLILPHLNP